MRRIEGNLRYDMESSEDPDAMQNMSFDGFGFDGGMPSLNPIEEFPSKSLWRNITSKCDVIKENELGYWFWDIANQEENCLLLSTGLQAFQMHVLLELLD